MKVVTINAFTTLALVDDDVDVEKNLVVDASARGHHNMITMKITRVIPANIHFYMEKRM